MGEAIRIEAALTRSDLRRWLCARLLRRPLLWIVPLFIGGVIAALRYACTPDTADLPSSTWPAIFIAGWAIMAAWMFGFSALMTVIWVARLKRDGMFLETKRITIDDAGIACDGDASSSRTSWKLVERLRLPAVGLEFALRDPRNGALLIPRHALNDATIAGIESLFARSRAT